MQLHMPKKEERKWPFKVQCQTEILNDNRRDTCIVLFVNMQQIFIEQILWSALCHMLKYNSKQDRFNSPKPVGKQMFNQTTNE